MMSSKRNAVTLVETVACVVIVSIMATSIIGVMQGSIRVAMASRSSIGAPAEARQTLRFISDRFRAMHETEGVLQVNASTVQCSNDVYRFESRKSLSGVGNDLFLIDDSGNETVCVNGSLASFGMQPILLGTQMIGVELQLALSKPSADAETLRPRDRSVKMATQVCFPPSMRAAR